MPKIVAAILAAGSASRFGSPKQLAKLGSKTLIDLALDALEDTGVEQIGVVLGCHFDIIDEHLEERKKSINVGKLNFQILKNPNWKNGLSSSIHTATKFAVSENATHLLLLACDQPLVNAALVRSLVEFAAERSSKLNSNDDDDDDDDGNNAPNQIIACKYGNSAGIPAIFPACYLDELMKIKGDRGAKSVILTSESPRLIDFPNGAHDIDHPADLDDCRSQNSMEQEHEINC